ncbi:tripartite tricarboxylate transporter substrate-binding protein [Reyranella sp. CPCC 100927]|uniref:tripartite tricarboxylate transporter substrate-binding protein n=1 Tax=Reyranella sp. CPCC 100927 TaxID=2599616 RepID=UPI0011B610EE|nr:tripartite tricarboxylate transporter substrate-binding protein [Reyranella sp. CPCC 100927]TWT10023.1 tripartite tricarboxylate transporter substrate binding protein BugD [Reyranella sp. CPCC 100927]
MRRLLCFVAAMVVLAAAGAHAQPYPSKPITIVVPFSAGGPTDTLARIMADRMSRTLGQTVLVDNTTGAAGTVGVGRVARAPADGYTIGIGHWSTHVVNGAVYKLNYDLLNDFAPVALFASNPQLLVAKKAVAAKDLKELVSWIKDNPDKVTVGTAGVGAASHVSGVYFAQKISGKVQFIPYRGAAPAMQDLVAGQIDIMFDQAANSLPQVRADKIKAYAVTAKTRLAAAPEIPTVDEAGLPGLYISVWHGLWLPKGTPNDIVAKLNAAVVEALADSTVREKFATLGQEIPPPAQQTPEALFAYHKAEIDLWWPLIKAAGIKVE